jgi:hypothetical protein
MLTTSEHGRSRRFMKVNARISSAVGGIDEAIIPDTFRKMPKLFLPGIHAWLDVAVTG